RSFDRLFQILGRHRVVTAVAVQGALAVAANLAALWLRFDGAPPPEVRPLVLPGLLILPLIRWAWLRPFNLYRDLWQYVGFGDLGRIVAAVSLGSGTFWLVLRLTPAFAAYPF